MIVRREPDHFGRFGINGEIGHALALRYPLEHVLGRKAVVIKENILPLSPN